MKKVVVPSLFYALFLMLGHGQANAVTTDLAYQPQDNINTHGLQAASGIENGTLFAGVQCESF